jgi:hypothetical protein
MRQPGIIALLAKLVAKAVGAERFTELDNEEGRLAGRQRPGKANPEIAQSAMPVEHRQGQSFPHPLRRHVSL